MKINYLKQSWSSIRQQPMVSTVSMIGTALAIFLIMVVVMMGEIQNAPYAPESNRDRWLVQKFTSIQHEDWDGSSNGAAAFVTIKGTIYQMRTPEAVTAFDTWPNVASLSVPGKAAIEAESRGVDDGFWKVMDFTFIDGKPFTKADFESAIPMAVISESVARKLFGTTEATGREFSFNHAPYRVCGVVRDVSNLATTSYAELWIPFTTTNTINFNWSTYMGMLSAIMLAKTPNDFPAIREEYNKVFEKFGDEVKLDGYEFIMRERPYTQKVQSATPWANEGPEYDKYLKKQMIIFLILLIVPAINLSSMTHSRLQKRREEIGIRRAFGAKRSEIITDIFIENLIITLVAGLIGLALSLIFALVWGGTIFNPGFGVSLNASGITLDVLFHWSTFGWAMVFCFFLNLLSAGIPAWNASRVNIVNAITRK
ncbi:MAG: ABC transporter permease [Bacteroides sp.]|nr:ABC transporter permease [Bacteroides sp.]